MGRRGAISPLFGRHRICAVVAASTAAAMLPQIRRALRFTRTLELRLDWLKSEREVAQVLAAMPSLRSRAIFIATCRRREAGGKFSGSIARQLARLLAACAMGCQWCDLEIEIATHLDLPKFRRLLDPASLVVSHHDFLRTPPRLDNLLRRLASTSADALKIATECHSFADSLRVLELARGRSNVIAVPMGEIGLPARVLALRAGSALAYASVGPATAPGQLSIEEMKTLYRAHRLDSRTKIYGVIGDPVGHSLSPLMHNTGFIQYGMNAVYLPFLVRDLRDFLGATKVLGIAGFSVTLPHKERIIPYLDACDDPAVSFGAVNTVTVHKCKLIGTNTDWFGVIRPLARRMRIPNSRILVYGAGGAARTAATALARVGAKVFICARRPAQAGRLARALGASAIRRPQIKEQAFDAIINATPLGMYPRANESPLEARELNSRIVFDFVYRPLHTKLLRLAAARGIKLIRGIEMFLAQGLRQWETWFRSKPPEAAMSDAVRKALLAEQRKMDGGGAVTRK